MLAVHTFHLNPLSYPLVSLKTQGIKKKARLPLKPVEWMPVFPSVVPPLRKRHLLGTQDNFQEKSLCSSWNKCENHMLEMWGFW